jgi:hypothetical protein
VVGVQGPLAVPDHHPAGGAYRFTVCFYRENGSAQGFGYPTMHARFRAKQIPQPSSLAT